MKTYLWISGLVVVAGCLLAAPTSGPVGAADDQAAAPVKADPISDDVRNIAMAYDLAAYGRTARSPESLVTAARILRQIRALAGTESSSVEGAGNDTEEKQEPISLLAESDRLLDEARKMAPDDAVIAQLADRVAKEKTRGSLRGPRSYTHQPGSGVKRTWNLRFVGGQPASVAVRGNGRNLLTLTVTGPGGHYLTWTGPNPSLSWLPRTTHGYTITVTNNGPGKAGYTLFHN